MAVTDVVTCYNDILLGSKPSFSNFWENKWISAAQTYGRVGDHKYSIECAQEGPRLNAIDEERLKKENLHRIAHW